MNAATLLTKQAVFNGDRIALSFADRAQTYVQLTRRVLGLAGGLLSSGLSKGGLFRLTSRLRFCG